MQNLLRQSRAGFEAVRRPAIARGRPIRTQKADSFPRSRYRQTWAQNGRKTPAFWRKLRDGWRVKAAEINVNFADYGRAMGIEPITAFLEATEYISLLLRVLEHFGTQEPLSYRPLRVSRRQERERITPRSHEDQRAVVAPV